MGRLHYLDIRERVVSMVDGGRPRSDMHGCTAAARPSPGSGELSAHMPVGRLSYHSRTDVGIGQRIVENLPCPLHDHIDFSVAAA